MTSARSAVLVVIGVLALLAPASPARAHAAMLASAPEAGSVVRAAPGEVTVRFSEPVTPVAGRTQVIAPDGKRVGGAVTASGGVLTVRLRPAGQPLGTYLVSYRVISADGHPVGGALTFSVGAPSARPAESGPDQVHPSVTAAGPAIKALGYAGLVLAIGPALLLALLWPRRLSRRGPVRLVRAGLMLIALATLATLWVQAPETSGAALWQVTGAELAGVVTGPYGLLLLGRLALLALVAALLPPVLRGAAGRARGIAVAVAVLTLAGLATWPLTGHAAGAPLSPVAVAAGVVHLAAMAVWLGGLVTLAAFLLRRAHARVLRVLLPAWSRWAGLAVVWLVGAGVVQAAVQLGSAGALLDTAYGRLLLVKTGVLAAVLAAAAYARRLVRDGRAAGGLRRTVGVELTATALVLGLSAVLVQTTPGRSAVPAETAATPDGVSRTLTSGLFTLQFYVYPVELGEYNTVHGFTYTPEGRPLAAEEMTVTTRLTEPALEPVAAPMLPLAPRNDSVGSLTFPVAGTYELTFTVRVSEIDQATVRTTITVPQASRTR